MQAAGYRSSALVLLVAARRTIPVALMISSLLGNQSQAGWESHGTPVCTTAVTGLNAEAYGVAAIPDGAAGVLMAWMDDRNFNATRSDIYAQRFSAAGVVAVGWTTDGVPVSTAPFYQGETSVTSDGAGGLFVTWDDSRFGLNNIDIYALRLSREGRIADGWPVGGAIVCGAPYNQTYPRMVPDEEGGAFVVWQDNRNFFAGNSGDIYLQRITGNGVPAAGWPQDGIAVCDTIKSQLGPILVADGAGGVIVSWRDYRAGSGPGAGDLYALRFTADGAIAPGWIRQGVPVCTAPGYQDFAIPTPRQNIVPDGLGGAIIAWQDHRNGFNQDLYAQRLMGSGSVAPGWPTDGLPVCTADGDQFYPAVLGDGQGGAIVAWQDGRNGDEIYAQHLTAAGTIPPGWPPDGLGVCTGLGNQVSPVIASDGVGGALIAWEDRRYGLGDIYAQRVAPQGTIAWMPNGAPVCVADSTQDFVTVVSDGFGGGVFIWEDERNGYPPDIYASRLGADGQVVTDTAVLGDRGVLTSVWPNPFSHETRIRIDGVSGQRVNVDIFDVTGRLVRSLFRDSVLQDGRIISWNGRSESGAHVPGGEYFLRVRWRESETRQKVLLVR